MFRLSAEETGALNRSQFATGSQRHRDPRFSPFAFTEQGAMMAGFMLNSPHAVEVVLTSPYNVSPCRQRRLLTAMPISFYADPFDPCL
jgi:hypothetical protein